MDKLEITDLDESRQNSRRKKTEQKKAGRRQKKKGSARRQKHPVLFALLDDLEVIGVALAISVFLLEFISKET